MKLLKAYATNFMSFKQLDWDFTNYNGISMINGWNFDDKAPSGAGKTALIDLIPYVLFCKSPRDIKVDEFINDQVNKKCLGGLHLLMDDGRLLIVERTRKPNDLYFQVGDGKPQRDTDLIETQKLLEDFIQLDFNTFMNSIYFAPDSDTKFISAKDGLKRDILTRILDLTEFDKAYETAKEQSKSVSKLSNKKETELVTNENIISSISSDIVHAEQQSIEFESQKEREIERKNEDKAANKINIQERERLISALKAKKFLPKPVDLGKPDLEAYDNKLAELLGEKNDLLQKVIEEPDCTELDKTLVMLERLESKMRDVDIDLEMTKKDRKKLSNTLIKVKDTGEGVCGECLQPIDEKHVVYLRENIDEKDAAIAIAEPKLKKIQLKVDELKNLQRVRRQKMANYGEELESHKREIVSIDLVISTKKNERATALQEYGNAVNEIKNYNNMLNADKLFNNKLIESNSQEIETFQKVISSLDADITTIQARKNGYGDTIVLKKQDKAAAVAELDKVKKSIDSCFKAMETLEILKKSYKNIKYYIFESTIDELNQRIDKYLEPLFNEDVKIEYKYVSGKNNDKLKFSTRILKNGKEKSYESLSEGEKRRAELATNFALSDIVAMRKANSLSLMILDEVFNGLPEECRERVVELLEVLKDEKDTILVIDHFHAMHTLIENTITVEKRDGISQIV